MLPENKPAVAHKGKDEAPEILKRDDVGLLQLRPGNKLLKNASKQSIGRLILEKEASLHNLLIEILVIHDNFVGVVDIALLLEQGGEYFPVVHFSYHLDYL